MDDHFLKNIREKIKKTPGLTIGGLALALEKSESQTYRILNGDAPYQAHYTRQIREYVGIGSQIDREGNNMAVIDLVDLKTAHSLEQDKDVICRITLLKDMLPSNQAVSNLRIVKITGDHCSPDYAPGDYVFVDVARVLPEPPGVFLLWTGIGYKLQFCEHIRNSSPPVIKLLSLNKDAGYETTEESLSKLNIKGRVIGKISIQKN